MRMSAAESALHARITHRRERSTCVPTPAARATSDTRDVTIPWIAWGRGVHRERLKDVPIRTFDTAATVLWLLGVNQPANWDGKPIVAAFQSRPAS